MAKLNAELRAALSTYPLVRINSPEHAIPHVLNLSVRNVKGTVFQRELDAKGVCVSVKSACSSDGLPSRAVFAVSRDRRNARHTKQREAHKRARRLRRNYISHALRRAY